mgnify:CR=1 FL=1
MRTKDGFLTNCLYFGLEAEGPNRGRRTLFVADVNATMRKILEGAERYEVEAVYFGAGGTFDVPWSFTSKDLTALLEKYKVVIEVNCMEVLWILLMNFEDIGKAELIYNITYIYDHTTYLKVDGKDSCRLYDLHNDTNYFTAYEEKEYREDFEIEGLSN